MNLNVMKAKIPSRLKLHLVDCQLIQDVWLNTDSLKSHKVKYSVLKFQVTKAGGHVAT